MWTFDIYFLEDFLMLAIIFYCVHIMALLKTNKNFINEDVWQIMCKINQPELY